MKELFEALCRKYPDAEVRDVKFIVNPSEANDQDVALIDGDLAKVVVNAKPLEGYHALR
jgi:hypothetical protein